MRIRKRLHSLITPPDLSSPPPPSMAAAAVAISGAAGGKEGEVIAAKAAEGGGLRGSGGGSGGGGVAGGGGRGLHSNGDVRGQNFHGCTTKPTYPLPFHPLPPEAATPEGEERRDLPPREPRLFTRDVPIDHSHGGEVPKGKQDGENGGDGDAQWRWNTDAHMGATAAAPKSLGAEVSKVSVAQGWYKTLSNGVVATSAKAEDVGRWSDEERVFPLKKRRGCYRARGTRFGGAEEEEENMVAEREWKPRKSNTRRRRVGASDTTTLAPTGTALTSAGTGGVGAPTAASGGAAKKYDDVVVKEEGGDVMPAVVDGSRGVGNGKKRRSPAVLMEGSRCSRVNGRGWRCCQQTLVGYSLCEHHLGKGRLRSVSSVRCNGRARKKEEVDGAALSQLPSPLQQKQQQQLLLPGDGEDEEEENPGKRRRKKIGMVKARSISSLLHQPDYSTPTAMAAPEPSPSPSPAPTTGPAALPHHDSDSVVV